MSIDFYIKGKPQKRKARPKQKRRKFPSTSTGDPRVSDHAVLRYIERVYEVPVDDLRETILSDMAIQAIKIGASGFTEDGVRYIIENGCVVTCYKVGAEA